MEHLAAGRSSRVLSRLTGVSHTQIADMRWGKVPSYRILERYLAALEVPLAEQRAVFAAAGYVLPLDDTADAAARRAVELARQPEPEDDGELTYEPDLDEIDISTWAGAKHLSQSDIEELNRIYRAHLAQVRRRGR